MLIPLATGLFATGCLGYAPEGTVATPPPPSSDSSTSRLPGLLAQLQAGGTAVEVFDGSENEVLAAQDEQAKAAGEDTGSPTPTETVAGANTPGPQATATPTAGSLPLAQPTATPTPPASVTATPSATPGTATPTPAPSVTATPANTPVPTIPTEGAPPTEGDLPPTEG